MNRIGPPHLTAVAGLALALFGMLGCARGTDSVFSPHESLLSIVNEYQLFQGVDLYRNSFPQDLTGQNVARATLVRLANYEELYPGRFAPEIEMLRGRALSDLGDYATARDHFLKCAEFDTALRPRARESADVAAQLDAIVGRTVNMASLDAHLSDRERQIADLQAFTDQFRGTRWEALGRMERETIEMLRAELIDANQFAIPSGAQRAQQAFEQVARDNPDSRRALSHALRIARFHLDQARLLEQTQDPERGHFDWSGFSSHLEVALDLLHRVSQADGHPEKVLARHQLDEALAYYEMIRKRAR